MTASGRGTAPPRRTVTCFGGVSVAQPPRAQCAELNAVRTVSAQHAEAGLRIMVDPVNDSLSMGIATAPAPEDAVIIRDGTRVFLSRSAGRRLHRRTLRAELSANRSLFFLDG
jgi:hypothetical protein